MNDEEVKTIDGVPTIGRVDREDMLELFGALAPDEPSIDETPAAADDAPERRRSVLM